MLWLWTGLEHPAGSRSHACSSCQAVWARVSRGGIVLNPSAVLLYTSPALGAGAGQDSPGERPEEILPSSWSLTPFLYFNPGFREFPCGPVVRTPSCHCRGHGFNP